jgi:hypothetical protein
MKITKAHLKTIIGKAAQTLTLVDAYEVWHIPSIDDRAAYPSFFFENGYARRRSYAY